MKLYFITGDKAPLSHLEQAEIAFSSGADLVQIRAKNASLLELKDIAKNAQKLSLKFDKQLIINDHPEVAKETGAYGVHIGESDSPIKEARKVLGPSQILGYTVNSSSDLEKVSLNEIDYIGLGPFRETKTKENHKAPLGIDGAIKMLGEIKKIKDIPVFLIGGIKLSDVRDIKNLIPELEGIAVSSGISFSEQPGNAVKEFKNLLSS